MRNSGLFIAVILAVALGVSGCAQLDALRERATVTEACDEINAAMTEANITQYGALSDPAETKRKLGAVADVADKYEKVLPGVGSALRAVRDTLPLDIANTTPLERSLFDSATSDLERVTKRLIETCP